MTDIKNVLYGKLNDYYGGLLTEYQSEVLRMYFDCDMSLTEIAQELNNTKQAVHLLITRSMAKLESYESKLGLVKKTENLIDEIKSVILQSSNLSKDDVISSLQKILSQVEEL